MKKVESGEWLVVSSQYQASGWTGGTGSASEALHNTLAKPVAHDVFHTSSLRPRGISLLEVLVAIFVLTFGLLGVAALIPFGQFALSETGKSDISGACGRVGLREIKIRRMLDYRYWSPTVSGTSTDVLPFAIDPLGYSKGLPVTFGSNSTTAAYLPRLTMRLKPSSESSVISDSVAQSVFFSQDDLVFTDAKDAASRPTLISANSQGDYSWFVTATPATTEMALSVMSRRLFNVSVVVCYKRNFDSNSVNTLDGEHTTTITSGSTGFLSMGIGGGTVQLNSKVNVKENQWVMLHNAGQKETAGKYTIWPRCAWYRVVGVGGSTNTLSLLGPDWDPSLETTLVVVPGAIGVYSTVVELDWDPLWTP